MQLVALPPMRTIEEIDAARNALAEAYYAATSRLAASGVSEGEWRQRQHELDLAHDGLSRQIFEAERRLSA